MKSPVSVSSHLACSLVAMTALSLTLSGCGGSSTGTPPVSQTAESTPPAPVADVPAPDPDPRSNEYKWVKHEEIEVSVDRVLWNAHLHKPRKDNVRWFNNSDNVLTITFADPWPFAEDSSAIRIEPRKSSGWFEVKPSAAKGAHRYVTQPFRADPIDPPHVDVGP